MRWIKLSGSLPCQARGGLEACYLVSQEECDRLTLRDSFLLSLERETMTQRFKVDAVANQELG